jgi:hypothetical protein
MLTQRESDKLLMLACFDQALKLHTVISAAYTFHFLF